MEDFFETLGKYAGIGGFSLGFILVIFREIIRKTIFPKLKQSQSYRIILTIIISSFVLAAIGLIFFAFSSYSNNRREISEHIFYYGEIVDVKNMPLANAWIYLEKDGTTTKKVASDTYGKFAIGIDSIKNLNGAILHFGKDSIEGHEFLYSNEYRKVVCSVNGSTKNSSNDESILIKNSFITLSIKKHIATILGRSYSNKSATVIEFKYEDSKLIELDENLYRYENNGFVEIYINGSLCNNISEHKLKASNSMGQSKLEIEKFLNSQVASIVTENINSICLKLKQCLK